MQCFDGKSRTLTHFARTYGGQVSRKIVMKSLADDRLLHEENQL